MLKSIMLDYLQFKYEEGVSHMRRFGPGWVFSRGEPVSAVLGRVSTMLRNGQH